MDKGSPAVELGLGDPMPGLGSGKAGRSAVDGTSGIGEKRGVHGGA